MIGAFFEITYNNEPKYKTQSTTYVYGIHNNNSKEYVWRVPAKWKDFSQNVQVGDLIQVTTKYGVKRVLVSRIEVLDVPPHDDVIKKVKNKQIKRDGVVMK